MVYDPADLKYEEDYPDFIIQSGQKFHLSYAFAPGERKDGLIVTVPETKLTLLEPHLTEWMVPGALRWKVEPMLRSLPKNIRKEIMPIGDLAEDFHTRLKNGELFTDQRFIDALADHIAETRGVVLDKADFDVFEAQEFQKMKIAVVDEDGKFMHFLYEVPDAARTGSRLKPNKKHFAGHSVFYVPDCQLNASRQITATNQKALKMKGCKYFKKRYFKIKKELNKPFSSVANTIETDASS